MDKLTGDLARLREAVNIWEVRPTAERLGIEPGQLRNWLKAEELPYQLSTRQLETLKKDLLPPAYIECGETFNFVDLFAGIGGLRKGFDAIGGRCVLTAEWDRYARRTYRANHPEPPEHQWVDDIKKLTQPPGVPEDELLCHIDASFPAHHVLLAGFPCQPFSIAGVSKKNALGRSHGFECEDQGQLFFDVLRILKAKKTPFAVLENVKNLKSHDRGNTFRVITSELENAGYWVADLDADKPDPKVVDGSGWVPQHRERVVLVCVRKEIAHPLLMHREFSLRDLDRPEQPVTIDQVLDADVPDKYTLTDKLWEYLQNYKKKHQDKGNGFGFGLIDPNDAGTVTRTLSARYYKDGSEILIDQGSDQNPRRLTPQECARLMGFVRKGESFRIPVSDTRAYKQFGNSVVVPVFEAVAQLLKPYIEDHVALKQRAA